MCRHLTAHPLTLAFRSEISQTASAGASGDPSNLRRDSCGQCGKAPGGSWNGRQRSSPGAPIPVGADCVCKFEDTTFTDTSVTITRSYRSGGNIVLRGEDLTAGDIVARQGMVIDSALMGTLATQNVAEPKVYRRPLAGVITTGSELCAVGEALTGGKIVNSNRYTFQGVLQDAGCVTEFFGCPGDSVDEIAEVMASAGTGL